MFKVVVFGYNFPHSKCETFIHILKKHNIKVSAYIAANKIKIDLPENVYDKKICQKPIFHPKQLCKFYDIPYYVSVHNSDKTIKILKEKKANLGIVAGARILNFKIIDSFKFGIVNFHPGKIPEASGLDGLMWSIYKNIKPLVTTHFIDNKIDAGKRIFERSIKLAITDRIEDIKYKITLIEYEELEKLCINYLSKNIKIPSKKIIKYKSNNKPMIKEHQIKTIKKFKIWKKNFV
jgi:folate-dependent phosphoribosylglycinamide formyltransferase PurN